MSFKTWLEGVKIERSPQFLGFQGNGMPYDGRPVQLCYAVDTPETDGQDYYAVCPSRTLTLTDPIEIRDPRYDNYGPPQRDLLPGIQSEFDREFASDLRIASADDNSLSILARIFHSSDDTAIARFNNGGTPILADAMEEAGCQVVPGYLRDRNTAKWRDGLGPLGYYHGNPGACFMALASATLYPQLRQRAGPREEEQDAVSRRVRSTNVLTRFVGRYRDDKGVIWDVWQPDGNEMSAWAQLVHPDRRADHVYDPTHAFRKHVRQDWIEAGRPSREQMEEQEPEKPRRKRKPTV